MSDILPKRRPSSRSSSTRKRVRAINSKFNKMPPSPSPNVVPSGVNSIPSFGKTSSLPAPPPVTENSGLVEILRGRLFFASFSKPPAPCSGVHYFSTDRSLVYWNFFLDFGPMNLGQTYRFCEMVQEKLAMHPQEKIVYYCANHGQRKANSIFLLCAYSMMILGQTAEEAYRPFQHISLPPFHDATPCACTYQLTVMDCLKGMEKARKLGFVNFETFNAQEYEFYEKVESGDLSWVFPGKFVAFAGPHEEKSYDEQYPTCVPEDYVPHFLSKKVGLVIRLNKKYYDESRFKSRGIDHLDLYYPDGSCPSVEILDRFLQICESRPQDEAIAVHCKAGLGRTGTCIGAYAMKHWGFTASEVIGWLRVARPGSIIGPQQQYMESIQDRMHHKGEPVKRSRSPLHTSVTIGTKPLTSVMPIQKEFDEEMDKTQGDYLINAKVHSPHAPTARKSLLSSQGSSGMMSLEETAIAQDTTMTYSSGVTTTSTHSALYSLRGVARKLYGVGK